MTYAALMAEQTFFLLVIGVFVANAVYMAGRRRGALGRGRSGDSSRSFARPLPSAPGTMGGAASRPGDLEPSPSGALDTDDVCALLVAHGWEEIA